MVERSWLKQRHLGLVRKPVFCSLFVPSDLRLPVSGKAFALSTSLLLFRELKSQDTILPTNYLKTTFVVKFLASIGFAH